VQTHHHGARWLFLKEKATWMRRPCEDLNRKRCSAKSNA
jgi:hypothetical protein